MQKLPAGIMFMLLGVVILTTPVLNVWQVVLGVTVEAIGFYVTLVSISAYVAGKNLPLATLFLGVLIMMLGIFNSPGTAGTIITCVGGLTVSASAFKLYRNS